MTTAEKTKPAGSKNLRFARMKRSARLLPWSEFRRQPSGILGLVVMVIAVALAFLAPVMFPASMLDVTQTNNTPNQAPNGEFLLGTDSRGIDVLAQLVWGSRASLLVAFSATAISMIIGTLMGMASGHFFRYHSGCADACHRFLSGRAAAGARAHALGHHRTRSHHDHHRHRRHWLGRPRLVSCARRP